MCLADRGKYFPRGQQYVFPVHIAGGQYLGQAVEVGPGLSDPFGDELIRHLHVQLDGLKGPVDPEQFPEQVLQGQFIVLVLNKQVVYSGISGLFMF